MKEKTRKVLLSILFFALPLCGTASVQHAAMYEEIRTQQSIGRVILSPDGRFFLYEWSRPYSWTRDTRGLTKKVAQRQQTWLYKVDVEGQLPTTSQYLFHPDPGASYWLGDLSPDSSLVTFYQLDNDDNSVKAGVWDITQSKLIWFDSAPDTEKFDQPAIWKSNEEVAYPTKLGWVRGTLPQKRDIALREGRGSATAKTVPCTGCSSLAIVKQGGQILNAVKTPSRSLHDVSLKLLGASAARDLTVFSKSTSSVLALYFTRGVGELETIFENSRESRMVGASIARNSEPMSVKGGSEVDNRRPLTVEDVARFTQIGNPQQLNWQGLASSDAVTENPVGNISPDGKKVAIVLTGGNARDGSLEGSLIVLVTATLLFDPQPIVVARFSSSTNYLPIAKVRWLADSETLIFSGTEGGAFSQVYRVTVRAQKVEAITSLDSQLAWHEATPSGGTLATFWERKALLRRNNPVCREKGCLVTESSIFAAGGHAFFSSELMAQDLLNGTTVHVVTPKAKGVGYCQDYLGAFPGKGGLSPNGRFALRSCRFSQWPDWWEEYRSRGHSAISDEYRDQFFLSDLRDGSSMPLGSAPHDTLSPPLWIDAGRRFVIAGREPLQDVNEEERATRAGHWAILVIDPENRHVERVARIPSDAFGAFSNEWDQRTETLTIVRRAGSGATGKVLWRQSFRRQEGSWSPKEFLKATTPQYATELPNGVRLLVDQSLLKPPILVAYDPKTRLKKQLINPNPWLAQRQLGRAEWVEWKATDGRIWHGSLYYPPTYSAGRRYPLYIQNHGEDWIANRFSMNGYASNYPGRALAAAEVFVLQTSDKGLNAAAATPEELPAFQASYESAIDYLYQRGLVDRTYVGITGFSAGGVAMGYALTHSPYLFKAGVFQETADMGWRWYLSMGGEPSVDAMYGASPFGIGLSRWLEDVPTFNLDRVRTPMLILDDAELLEQFDWYAGLRILGKPVEYWVQYDREHQPVLTSQRNAWNRLTIDWVRFWLKDEEDSDPAKSGQYARWREFRVQQEMSVMMKPRPLLEWRAAPLSEGADDRDPGG